MTPEELETPEGTMRAGLLAWLEGLDLRLAWAQVVTAPAVTVERAGYPRIEAVASSVEFEPFGPIGAVYVENEEGDEVEARTADGVRVWEIGERTASISVRFLLAREADADTIRATFPRALVRHAIEDESGDGRLTTRIPLLWHNVPRDLVIYWEGRDTLETAEDTGSRDRWILRYEALADYPWLERDAAGIPAMGITLAREGRPPIDLEDIDPAVDLGDW